MGSLRTILVHLKAYEEWTPSIDAAVALAQLFNAQLTGLYTIRELAMIKLVLGENHHAAREAEARDAPLADAMRTRFLDACKTANVRARFDVGEGNTDELLSLAGRCHDLVVISEAGSDNARLATDSAQACAVTCGSPTLIVPRSADHSAIGRCIAVAWNHSRQSAVALRGALPLIEQANRVVLLTGQERDALPSVTKRPEADVAAYVRLYASNVEVLPLDPNSSPTGASLQSAARDAGADLLVMGAYGRSAWREFVFGGTTREVLAQLQLPVLMGH